MVRLLVAWLGVAVIVTGPVVVLVPRDAAFLALLLRAGRSDARRNGWQFSAGQCQLLGEVEALAGAHREQVRQRATRLDVTNVTVGDVTGSTMVDVSTTTAAIRLQIGEPAVRKLIRSGQLPGRKVHGQWVIDVGDLNDEIERRTAA